jgi:hypothetical protein
VKVVGRLGLKKKLPQEKNSLIINQKKEKKMIKAG